MWAGLAGMAVSVGMIHPHELSYFNVLAGGPLGGRRILSDSCLDWGQGARSLARLQARHPEFREWRWSPPDELVEMIVPFKRSIYRAVLEAFAGRLGA